MRKTKSATKPATKPATKHATKPVVIVNYSERRYKDYDYNAKKYAQVIPEYSENIESFVLPKTRKVKKSKPLTKAETKPLKKPKPRKPERKPKSRKQEINLNEINLNIKTRIQERKEENQTKKAKYVITRLQARKAANQTRKAANMTADEKRQELQKRIQERKEKDRKGQGTRM